MKKLLACVLILAAAAAIGAPGATAQQYPTRPIKILIPIPPGGAPDIAARILGEKLN